MSATSNIASSAHATIASGDDAATTSNPSSLRRSRNAARTSGASSAIRIFMALRHYAALRVIRHLLRAKDGHEVDARSASGGDDRGDATNEEQQQRDPAVGQRIVAADAK